MCSIWSDERFTDANLSKGILPPLGCRIVDVVSVLIAVLTSVATVTLVALSPSRRLS